MVTRSSPAPVEVHRWFAPPWHVQIWTVVPLALLTPVTSRHLPDRGLTRVLEVIAASAVGASMTVAATATATATVAVPAAAGTQRSLILMGLSRGREGMVGPPRTRDPGRARRPECTISRRT